MSEPHLDDLLDALVAEYSDRLRAGQSPDRGDYLRRVPPEARPGFERSLKMIEAGLADTPSAARPLAPGLKLDHYELVRSIGRGGMAIVWLARDLELERPVALKILRPGLALEQRHADRFRREALAIASLRHPHVVQVFGVGSAHGYHYIAMEFVEGPSLATVLEALPTDRPRQAEDLARAAGIPALADGERNYEMALAELVAPVAAALQAAHDIGLVHRDVKPSNILIRRDGRAVVADFGLAKGEGDPALSLTGDALGTPYYMSPEQAYVTGRQVDHRTDVYSLGVTLYEALAGKRPFGGDSFLEVIEAIRSTVPPSLRGMSSTCSRDANALVRKAMEREPEARYASASELERDLQSLARGVTTTALQQEGGWFRRYRTLRKQFHSGQPFEYRSARTFLGLPLVHVYSGPRRPGQGKRVAKGWYAVGDLAIGGFAAGPAAVGGIAVGGMAAGLFASGGLAAGLLCWGGMALGLVSMGGISVGGIAFGGIALGYGAYGGIARGIYAAGGNAGGRHVLNGDDPDVGGWFTELFESLTSWMG